MVAAAAWQDIKHTPNNTCFLTSVQLLIDGFLRLTFDQGQIPMTAVKKMHQYGCPVGSAAWTELKTLYV